MLCGQAVTFVSVLQLRRHKIQSELQHSGLFRWSRNPGLVGMYVFYLGLCFLFPCVVLFVGLIPYVWNMHTRVLYGGESPGRTPRCSLRELHGARAALSGVLRRP